VNPLESTVAERAVLPIINYSNRKGCRLPVLQSTPTPAAAAPSQHELDRILRLTVPVIVKLAERKLSLSEVLRLGNGAIIEFFKSSEEPLELLINNKPIAVGETVKVGENFGLRITQVGDVRAVIRSLGALQG
jgi:flagellar motor switch protein FliN